MGFKVRVDGFVDDGFKFNTIAREYALKDKVVKTGNGEDDFIIDKVPYIVDEYDISKEVNSRARGKDCVSICKRIQDGEVLVSDRVCEYGDKRNTPQTLVDALQTNVETSEIIEKSGLDKLSKEQLSALKFFVGKSPKEIEKMLSDFNEVVAKSKAAEIKAAETPMKSVIKESGVVENG